MDNYYTKTLAGYAAGLRYEDIPREVREHAKIVILDGLGCGLYGSTMPWSKILADSVREMEADGKATIWGTKQRTSPPHAALINGTAVQGFEVDDLHQVALLHGGSVILPATMALAQLTGRVSGRDFLAAVIAGYEVACRVSLCMGTHLQMLGWHGPSIGGIFAAAAAAGRVLGLNEERMVDCFGHAGAQAAGIMAVQFGAMAKRYLAGRASQAGLYSAFFASKGFTGIPNVFEAEYGGFCTAFSASKDKFDRSKLVEGLGEKYETLGVGLKLYACCGASHSPLDAIKLVMQQRPLSPEEIEKITVRMSTVQYEHVGWKYVPDTVTTAQFNVAYDIAALILEGDCFVDQFADEKLRDPRILALTERIEAFPDEEVDARGMDHRNATRVEVKLKSGEVRRAAVEQRRVGATRQEAEDKFRKLASKVLSERQMGSIIDRVQGMDSLGDVATLAEDLTPR